MKHALVAATAIAAVIAVRPLGAQVQHTPQIGPARAEVRAELIAGRPLTLHAGGGLLWPIGRNVRLGLVAGAGTSRVHDDAAGDARRAWRSSARGEIVARFVIDRRDQGAWRAYGLAGAGMLGTEGASPLARVFVGVGLEREGGGPRMRPAIELGVGGGVRAAVVLRQPRREP